MKSFFRMGIPVAGKNYFPSNIQGLPTWYEIRVSRDGYRARSGGVDLMVAMNAQTYAKDLAEVSPGGYLLYDSTWPRSHVLSREDVTVLGVPFAQLCNEAFDGVRTRILMKNMVYVGALAALLDIDMAALEQLAQDSFGKRPGLVEANMKAIMMGRDYALANFDCPLPFRVEAMNATGGMVMMDGNTTAGLGCVYAGATVGDWYPITPSTSLLDPFRSFSARFRVDPETRERRYCVVQAEDELAAVGRLGRIAVGFTGRLPGGLRAEGSWPRHPAVLLEPGEERVEHRCLARQLDPPVLAGHVEATASHQPLDGQPLVGPVDRDHDQAGRHRRRTELPRPG
jgi:2-oxoglutarate ferredoxin oxidoreductase subunit alpha